MPDDLLMDGDFPILRPLLGPHDGIQGDTVDRRQASTMSEHRIETEDPQILRSLSQVARVFGRMVRTNTGDIRFNSGLSYGYTPRRYGGVQEILDLFGLPPIVANDRCGQPLFRMLLALAVDALEIPVPAYGDSSWRNDVGTRENIKEVVEGFLDSITPANVGTEDKLSDEENGEVVRAIGVFVMGDDPTTSV